MRKFLSFFLLAGLLACTGVATAQQEFITGHMSSSDSAYTVPTSSWHNYSLTQMVINHGQMPGAEGQDFKINSISFYNTGQTYGSSTVSSRKIVVYMRNVNHPYFTSNSDYFTLSDTDRVFVGNWNISSTGWNTINLQKQFLYKNSSSTNHLLIAIYDSTNAYQGHYFRCWNRRSGAQVLSYRSDSYDPNPEAGSLSTYAGTKDTFQTRLPVLKLGYTIDSVTTATLPYTTNSSNHSENQVWHIKSYPDHGHLAGWKFYENGSNSYLYCGAGQDDYDIDEEVTSLIERKIRLGNSDSIRVSFTCTVGGEGGPVDDETGYYYDYLSVYLVPNSTNWAPSRGTTPYTGYSYDSILTDVLYFGEYGRIASMKIAHRTNETLTSTFVNPYPGQKCKLVFVWRNDGSDGDGYSVRSIKNLSVTPIDRQPEYTPQSTAQWYAYAYWLRGENRYPWQEHFIRFSMQNLANVDTASAHFDHDMYSGTYAGGYVWYNQGDNDKITRANISNNFVSGSINYTIPTLTGVIVAMQYNPADNKMYFITSDKKLCSFDISDPEHYTVMGQLSISITAFAINAQGEAYVIEDESNGSLYRINLNNGTTTLVGSSGIHIEDYSAMAFDYSTGELFLALYDDNDNDDNYSNTAMFYVNTSNGEMKYIGKLLDRIVEVSALFAVQTVTPQGIATAQAAELSVYPNPAKDQLHVNGVENGTMLLVYDMTGKIVAQQTATENTVINVSGLNKGVYVVAAGERKIKFVKE